MTLTPKKKTTLWDTAAMDQKTIAVLTRTALNITRRT